MPPARTVAVRAPAKINLCLYVLNREPTGHHRIVSLMRMVGLYDRLVLTRRPPRHGIRLITENREIPRDSENLVVRAARGFMDRYGIKGGLRIDLDKRIPVGAGLGGGSSDAAAAVRGLCRLYRTAPDRSGLTDLCRSLGSDVPFFLGGAAAWVTGTGEEIHPSATATDLWAVLVNPGFPVSTAWAYVELDRVRSQKRARRESPPQKRGLTSDRIDIKILSCAKTAFPLTRRSFSLHNDLEAITIGRYPVIETIKERLRTLNARGVLMSGSGPTVFGLFFERSSAISAAAVLRKTVAGREAWKIWAVRLLKRPPA